VGDTTHDLLTARAAGLRAGAVTYGAQSEEVLRAADPPFVAHDFGEVLSIVKSAALTRSAKQSGEDAILAVAVGSARHASDDQGPIATDVARETPVAVEPAPLGRRAQGTRARGVEEEVSA
jgi:hypothetical protein